MSPVAQTPALLTTPEDHMDASHQDHHHAAAQPHAHGGGGDGRESSGGSGASAPTANGHSNQQPQPPQQHQPSSANKRNPAQKDAYWFAQGDNTLPSKQPRASLAGPNDQFFGEGDEKSSGLSAKDREDRVRNLRERQQMEKHQKLEELKEHAAAAQRFREQQENERRRRLEDMKFRDAERRTMVEERKRIIHQAEQDRREAVIRKTAVSSSCSPLQSATTEREQRMESKRRNERSSIVFAFGSSTPRMLDPKDNNSASYWGSRSDVHRATSTTNVHLADTSLARRASECGDTDLSRKRATSAHGLDRKPEDLRMSSSMYEVFHWDKSSSSDQNHPPTTQGTRLTKSRDSSLERKTPPSALTWVRPFTPQPLRPTSTVLSSKEAPPPPSSTSSSSSDKTPTNASRFSVWEFGDNFTALGPMNQSSGGNGNQASPSPASTPTSTTRYTHRTASVFTGAGCTVGAEDLMTRSMTAAIPASAARRRTDLMPVLPTLRDHTGARTSPRHRSPGMRSGTVTPNSPSRPTSALSQGSTNSSQVSLRTRTSPRKPRPQSIAGCSLSSADKPRDVAATPPRESRAMERKLSVGSASSGSKPTRAKSAGSDRSAPATPARTPIKNPTPKKTPAQVKAESAAKKAAEKSKATPKTKSTPKTTPLQSPAMEAKLMPGGKDKKISPPREEKAKDENKKPEDVDNADENKKESSEAKSNGPDSQDDVKLTNDQEQTSTQAEVPVEKASVPDASSVIKMELVDIKVAKPMDTTETVTENKPSEADTQGTPSKPNEKENSVEPADKSLAQKAAEKPITGYATEEEYKAAMGEKRRLAREAKERELELERQRQLEEEERERREEEEYLKMMEDQRKAEEERLKKAIEEADRNRVEEAKRKEEEEKQREENERIEALKKLETEERLRKEEEERQARKSRVAAIMARTRGKGGSNTPTKNEAKTPSEDGKNFGDGMMSTSMTDSMISSIVDAAEAEAQAHESAAEGQESKPPADAQASSQASEPPVPPTVDSQATLGYEAAAVSQKQESDSSSHMTEVITVDSTSSVVKGEISVEVTTTSESNVVEDIISSISSVKVEEPHVNGDSPVPMDTTPIQSVDLLGTLSDVHSVNHNGVDNTPPQTSQGTENLLGSLEPLNSSHTSATTPAASDFEQIIDLGQIKLSNEDAVNSNPSPFIAFEQNLNKKQSQENTSTVPDLLL